MPRAVIASGVADVILPVEGLVSRLAELARAKENVHQLVNAADSSEPFEKAGRRKLAGLVAQYRRVAAAKLFSTGAASKTCYALLAKSQAATAIPATIARRVLASATV